MMRLPYLLLGTLLCFAACTPQPQADAGATDLPMQDLSLPDRAAWQQALQWPRECEESYEPAVEAEAGMTFYPLEPGRYLIEVVCYLAAYQREQLFLTYRQATPPQGSLLQFPTYAPDEQGGWQRETAVQLVGLPDFDPRTRELSILTRFRGLGDCGSLARYRIGQAEPELLEFRGKAECDGEVGEWPRLAP